MVSVHVVADCRSPTIISNAKILDVVSISVMRESHLFRQQVVLDEMFGTAVSASKRKPVSTARPLRSAEQKV